ncbi:MAG: insulinase family protein, partial [Desulfovibrionaceae bacterium]|nr:insulinase family protein [Desulfovibrionaceae bacterium]
TEVEENFELQMLDHILIGLPGSPLRRALIESGLGDDITGHGLENELREMYFSIGLRGLRAESVQDVEVLIMDTLDGIYEDGVPAEAVEAAVNSVEFALREKNSGRFPVGLAVMLSSLSTWLYDGDPLALLAYEKPLSSIKERLARGERIFENLIKKWFLDNRHRTTVVLMPDYKEAARQTAKEAERLSKIKEGLSESELEQLMARTKELRAIQEAPEDPVALAAIPVLKTADLPQENRPIPREEGALGRVPLLFHPQATGGIVYADLMFNAVDLEQELIPMLPLFGRAVLEMGNARRNFAELGMHMAAKTGGLAADCVFLTSNPFTTGSADTLPAFSMNGKATMDKAEDLAEIFAEVLLCADFDDKSRFMQIALEEKARQEQALIPAGHSVVALRLAGALNQTAHLCELTSGISYLDSLRELIVKIEKSWPEVLKNLEAVREALICSDGLALNITARPEDRAACEQIFSSLLEKLPVRGKGSPCARLREGQFVPARLHEALTLPAQVNYVGTGVNLYDLGYKYDGSIHVILKYLRTGYLWEEVRVKGGAYGAMVNFDRMTGTLCLVSYRDPNVSNTLEVYARVGEHLRGLRLERSELERNLVGAIGELDVHLLPDAKGNASFARFLTGDNDEFRQRMRSQILNAGLEHFHELGEILCRLKEGSVCLLGGQAVEDYAKENGLNARAACAS